MARTGSIAKAAAATIMLMLTACGGDEANLATPGISVENGFIRTPAPNAISTGGYVSITAAAGDTLLGARSEAADVEIHNMTMNDGVMSMRPVASIVIEPGKTLELKPGGYHLMLINPDDSISDGTDVDVILIFEKAGEVTISLPVKKDSGQHHH